MASFRSETLGEVLEHLLARSAPGEQTLPAVQVHAPAVPDVQHEELGALADVRVLGRGVRARADAGVAHEHEQLGGLLLLHGALAFEGLLLLTILVVGPIPGTTTTAAAVVRSGQVRPPCLCALT